MPTDNNDRPRRIISQVTAWLEARGVECGTLANQDDMFIMLVMSTLFGSVLVSIVNPWLGGLMAGVLITHVSHTLARRQASMGQPKPNALATGERRGPVPWEEGVTPGEACVRHDMPINGVEHVTVGILGTKKVIAVCGLTDAADFEESRANAVKLAVGWNALTAYSSLRQEQEG